MAALMRDVEKWTERWNVAFDIVKLFVEKKHMGACLVSSALFSELTNAEVVEGYLVYDDQKFYIRHYWAVLEGYEVDIGSMINRQLFPIKIKTRLSTEKPSDDYKYQSSGYELTRIENGFKLFKEHPKRFWKNAPGWIRRYLSSKKKVSNKTVL